MIYLTVIAGLEALVIAGLVAALLVHSKGCAELVANLDERHAVQTNRMVAAIQRPDLVQPATPPKRRSHEDLAREQARAKNLATVGTVSHAKGD